MQVTLNIELKHEYPRLCFAEMPLLQASIAPLFDYTADSDMAAVIPLFYGRTINKYRNAHELSVHGFCKRAMWLAYELLNWTDFREQGLTLYIGGTKTVKRILTPYLSACGFPDKFVLWTDVLETDAPGHLMKFPLMKKALKNPKIKKVLTFDTGVYFVKEQTNDIFWRMKEAWTDAPVSNFYPVWQKNRQREIDDFQELDYKRAVSLQTFDVAEESYYKAVSDVVGMSVQDFKDFWNKKYTETILVPEGRTQGYTREVLEANAFSEFFDQVKMFTGNDMAFTSLYWQKFLGKSGDITYPKGIRWYPKHPAPIDSGNIGFLNSGASTGRESRKTWIKRYEDYMETPLL